MKYSIIVTLFFISIVLSCASPGIPEGGPKDEEPPVVTKSTPNNYITNFDKNKIEIFFSEFVQLNDIKKNFSISPIQRKPPKIRLKGKSVEVKFLDSLKQNTTYVLDFSNAIVDNNEGLPLFLYRYVFSTGDMIDTLG